MLKSGQLKTVRDAAPILGRNCVTRQKWLNRYRAGGLAGLWEKKASSGRPRAIPQWAEAALQKRLQEPQGLDGYQGICDWLETQFGIQAADKTVHQLVHDRWQSSPKVPRPVSLEQSSEAMDADNKT